MSLAGIALRSAETPDWAVPGVLRLGMAGCFIGHGAFGIITKAAWVPYFGVAGITEPWAWKLMPWIGTMDILIGLAALFWSSRALLVWAAGWALWTALLRPLSGEPFWETLERAGNYGVPLALLIAVGWSGAKFDRLPDRGPELDSGKRARLEWALRLTTFFLLIGHAGLGWFSHKTGLATHYAALGVSNPTAWVPVIGALEFFLAALVLLRPRPSWLIAICLWKLATESLFLVAGAPIWELVERAGSYAAPLALGLLLLQFDRRNRRPDRAASEHKSEILYA